MPGMAWVDSAAGLWSQDRKRQCPNDPSDMTLAPDVMKRRVP